MHPSVRPHREDLLAGRGYDTRDTVLAYYGRVDRDVRSGRDHVLAVGLDDLYAEAGASGS